MAKKGMILGSLAAVVLIALVVASRSGQERDPAVQPTAGHSDSHGSPAAATPTQATPTEAAAEPLAERVPHFHERLKDALPLPKILPAGQFRIPVVAKAYRIAARIPEVLAQQPCYCWCDKIGHGSLVDCFATEHGAG